MRSGQGFVVGVAIIGGLCALLGCANRTERTPDLPDFETEIRKTLTDDHLKDFFARYPDGYVTQALVKDDVAASGALKSASVPGVDISWYANQNVKGRSWTWCATALSGNGDRYWVIAVGDVLVGRTQHHE